VAHTRTNPNYRRICWVWLRISNKLARTTDTGYSEPFGTRALAVMSICQVIPSSLSGSECTCDGRSVAVIPEITPLQGRSRVGMALCVVFVLVFQPRLTSAQCAATSTVVVAGPPTKVVKYFSIPIYCASMMQGGVVACDPPCCSVRSLFYAVNIPPNNSNEQCSWTGCTVTGGGTPCPTIIIDKSDGLPVELLDFKVTSVPKPLGPLAATGKTAPTPSPHSDSSRVALIPAVR